MLNQLGELIVFGTIQPGTVLRIEELETRFSVSRGVIREAIRALASMNVVAARRRVGVTVVDRAAWNVFDPRIIRWRLAGADRLDQLQSLSELRTGVEPVAAALAAERARPEDCAELLTAAAGMSATGQAGDLERYLEHDIAFHRALLHASGNEMFASLTDVVAEVLSGRTRHHLMPPHPEVAAIRLHIEIAHAIQLGDSARARQAMTEILTEAREAIVKIASEHEE
ncbi:MAG: Transcriptional regulator, GntR family [Frankiales bacterium]|nr:Transcriptional regulator, GntR family [Frankiales bacterium]